MPRPRKTYDVESLRIAVERSVSWRQVHKELGLSTSGSSYKGLQRTARENGIDTSHFTGQAWDRKEKYKEYENWGGRKPLDQVLVKESDFSSAKLKKRLLDARYLENICVECGLGSEWNNKPLTLQLDHVNGDSRDNRIENLRILCPNCHTQTPTYGAKNR